MLCVFAERCSLYFPFLRNPLCPASLCGQCQLKGVPKHQFQPKPTSNLQWRPGTRAPQTTAAGLRTAGHCCRDRAEFGPFCLHWVLRGTQVLTHKSNHRQYKGKYQADATCHHPHPPAVHSLAALWPLHPPRGADESGWHWVSCHSTALSASPPTSVKQRRATAYPNISAFPQLSTMQSTGTSDSKIKISLGNSVQKKPSFHQSED